MTQKRIKRYARRLDNHRFYKPIGVAHNKLQVVDISLDEFEAMRLVDMESLSQVEAAIDMQVSRATIQRLLSSGRKKLIDSILHHRGIEIKNDIQHIKLKGENKMNIADKTIKIIAFPTSDKVTIDDDFARTKEFAIYTIEDTDIVDVKHITPPIHEIEAIPNFLAEQQIDVMITGCMGEPEVHLFHQQQIDVILGAKGRIDVNLSEYLGGLLSSQGSSCAPNHQELHQRD